MKINNKTHSYYEENATEYFNNTFHLDTQVLINDFSEKILRNTKETIPKILDVGCGSGRDSLKMIQKGFDVTSFDSSQKLTQLASEKIQQDVLCLDMESLEFEQFMKNKEFDGIFAMASLLHLKKEVFKRVVPILMNSLKENGVLFMALKPGKEESFDSLGRFFSYYEKEELENLFTEWGFHDFSFKQEESDQDKLGRKIQWINMFIHKTPQPIKIKKPYM